MTPKGQARDSKTLRGLLEPNTSKTTGDAINSNNRYITKIVRCEAVKEVINIDKYRIDLYQIWHKSKSLHSEHSAGIYLNQLWKTVAPSSE